jgi:glyoxylase-like metal-dependent hydrolase (beta-lactamase superfamily II)
MESFKVGAATVTRIEETYEPNFEAAKFFSDWRPGVVDEHASWMLPHHYDPDTAFIKLSIHSWLIDIGGKKILIDGCVGNHKPRPLRPKWHMLQTQYLERLAAAGVEPDDVDLVMCTHLHLDHVGWNTRLRNGRWEPTFPKARYVFSQADYDHYRKLDADPTSGPANHGSFRDSVLPVVDAGLADIVAGAHTIDEHLSIDPHPGHTPGTVAINLASLGASAQFCGDILHHMIQVYHPEWNSFACADGDNARKSRRRVLEHCAGTGALLMPAHFGVPFVCHIDSRQGGFVPRTA